MNKTILLAAVFATALSGCATYDYAGGSAPGGYYHGRPTTEYYGPYGGGYGYPGSSIYIGSGYGYYGYSRYPYYGHYNPYYPYYPPYYRPPRPHNPDHGHQPPKPPTGSGNRAPPWRDPTNGAWRESGQVMIPPRHENRVTPAPSAPRVRSEVQRPAPSAPRPAPPPSSRVERAQPAVERRPAVRSSGTRGVQEREP